ncbi:MAG: peptidoglycan-binding domain-containing protein [Candidatus Gracilibacteria bacterium]|nr:peptidoglycan-binding domain-containing protein [Candidatus Gracilibacteria bacterium]
MIKKTLEKIILSIEDSIVDLSKINHRYFLYFAVAYIIYALHHFFPEIYNLYTFENFTIFFMFQIVLIIFYERVYFMKILKIYFKEISGYFSVSNFILAIISFFGIFFFYIYGQDISILNGLLVILAIGYGFNSFYRNDDPEIIGKTDLNKTLILSLVITNVLLYLYMDKFLTFNGVVSYVMQMKVAVLIIFDCSFIYLFSNMPETAKEKSVQKINSLPRKTHKALRIYGNVAFVAVMIIIVGTGSYYLYDSYLKSDGIIKKSEVLPSIKEEPVPIESNEIETSEGITDSGALNQSGENNTGSLIPGGTVEEETIIAKKKIADLYVFPRYIGVGDSGKDITQLQQLLKNQGYYTGAISGKYDAALGDSVVRFIRMKTGTRVNYIQLGPKAMAIFKNIEIE